MENADSAGCGGLIVLVISNGLPGFSFFKDFVCAKVATRYAL
jgi:hypothetical protein